MGNGKVIVVGLGAHGSAAAYHLARRGVEVLGVEAFPRGHTNGSSGGHTRAFHLLPGPYPGEPELLERSWDLWLETGSEAGEELLLPTGYLNVGPASGDSFTQDLADARRHGLEHEVLDLGELRRRVPVFAVDQDWKGLLVRKGGLIWCERAIEAHLTLAARLGAQLRFGESVESWSEDPGGVEVSTSEATHRADALVIAAGAWNPKLLPAVAPFLTVRRVEQFWFEPDGEVAEYGPDRLPTWNVDDGAGTNFHGFPYFPDIGVKAALMGNPLDVHSRQQVADPETLDRRPTEYAERSVRLALRRRMPRCAGRLRAAHVCMETHTPDRQFLIDRYPDMVKTVFASACSSHGYGVSPVIGEVLADLAIDGRTRHEIGYMALDRFPAP